MALQIRRFETAYWERIKDAFVTHSSNLSSMIYPCKDIISP